MAVGALTVRASMFGFVTVNRTLQVPLTGTSLRADFTLTSDGTVIPWNLAGEHTMTVTADSTCNQLPTVARSRTYQATATSTLNPTVFIIRLRGATFLPGHNELFATVGTTSQFGLPSADDGPPVTEVMNDGAHLEMYGFGFPIGGWSNNISARFSGSILHCPLGGSCSQCVSANHSMTFTRN